MKKEKNTIYLHKKNKKIEKELKKAEIVIKMQKELIKKFQLMDDAGTAYIYLGPEPEEIERKQIIKSNMENMELVDQYDCIINKLSEIEIIQEKSETNNEIKKKIEEIQNEYIKRYVEEKTKEK